MKTVRSTDCHSRLLSSYEEFRTPSTVPAAAVARTGRRNSAEPVTS